ncbi:MAG TPA: isopentenyl-diphosphate Delta-isomerase [Bacteroidales bacterium]|nr:isopentenyl-diphosphate Delta-isomerase [Bacteroidales bacterium]
MLTLVNEKDEKIGEMPKLEAHQKGLLHRAFSIFIFNSKKELLLQQRAFNKYHSAGLWSNTCCSHPLPDEDILYAANRRLFEEVGLKVSLKFQFKFQYKVNFNNQLFEHEIDHVFVGFSDEIPKINKFEINDYKFVKLRNVKKDIKRNPSNYTEWFKIILNRYL